MEVDLLVPSHRYGELYELIVEPPQQPHLISAELSPRLVVDDNLRVIAQERIAEATSAIMRHKSTGKMRGCVKGVKSVTSSSEQGMKAVLCRGRV